MDTKKPLIAIVGPTASGKTDLAIRLAKKFRGEILCADSRTIYKEMNIGTAKPTKKEQNEIPHHGLDLIYPDQDYSVAEFKKYAEQKIREIQKRDKLVFMVGGSGLYIDSVLYDFKFAPEGAPRDKTNPRHLKKEVPHKRQKLSSTNLVLGLSIQREELRSRLESRVDQMFSLGLVDEVKRLNAEFGGSRALSAPGYSAVVQYIEGEVSLDESRESIITSHFQLAKRQMTWFKRNKHIKWVTSNKEAEQAIKDFLTKFDTIEP